MSAAVSTPRPALTRDDPFPKRFYAWAQDRFPPPVSVVFLVMFGGGAFGAAIAAGEKPALSIGRVLGALALVAFYLGVRIYDEHKDYELDTRVHPDRLTVSGVMPLRDLRVVQAVGLVFQAAVCVAFDGGIGPVTLTWLAATVWSLLMLKEFFIGEWLGPRMVLYALSHQLVVPLTAIWVSTFGTGELVLGAWLGWLSLLVLASGLTFELTRKLHAPEDERPGVDSYTKAIGLRQAPLVALAVMVVGAIALVGLLTTLQGSLPLVPTVIAAVLLAVTATPLALFAASPTSSRAKALEPAAALSMAGTYLIVLVTVLVQGGLTWQ